MFKKIYSNNNIELFTGDFPIDEDATKKINPNAMLLRDFRKRETTNKVWFLLCDNTEGVKKVYFPNSDINILNAFFNKDPELKDFLKSCMWEKLYEDSNILIKKSKVYYNDPLYLVASIDGKIITCNPYKNTIPDVLKNYFKNNIEQFNSISNYFSEAIRNSIQNEEEENENN